MVSFLFCIISLVTDAGALETVPYTPSPELMTSPIITTGYSRTGSHLDYVQIYNNSDTPVNLNGWSMEYHAVDESAPRLKTELSGWIAPANYLVAADAASVSNADFLYELSDGVAVKSYEVRIVPPTDSGYATNNASPSEGTFWRKISDSTGKYTKDFAIADPEKTRSLSGGGFYNSPESTLLQVSEIYANSSDCSPLSASVLCGDYVKLYNPSDQVIDLSDFRLRAGYQGQNSTSSNTYLLVGEVLPGHYAVISKSADSRSISITNSGGYIWLEDTYGIKMYDSTVAEYTDASADSKKGLAWAYDSISGTWKWTTRPTPSDTPSVFPAVAAVVKTESKAELAPCKEGQYRSEETNRCRSIVAAAAVLAECPEGQTRNPETNRCRTTAALASELTPCAEGQVRNPETNRCRKVTNSVPEAAFAVEPVKDSKTAFAGWWTLGGVGVLAVGYGVWEWRQEMMNLVRRISTFFTSGK